AGAGAGAIYDLFSKSSDKKKFEKQKEAEYQRRRSAYYASKKKAESQAWSFKNQKYKEYEQELKDAADARMNELNTK
ncbi:MAG: hypothetical protein AAF558_13210, partial [Verrucomicrobiota bacterium]